MNDLKIGDRVIYTNNKKSDHGVITSLSNKACVFVRYDFQHETAPGQLTPIIQLSRELKDD